MLNYAKKQFDFQSKQKEKIKKMAKQIFKKSKPASEKSPENKVESKKELPPPMTELDKYIVATAHERYQQYLNGDCSSVEEAFAEIKEWIEKKYHDKL